MKKLTIVAALAALAWAQGARADDAQQKTQEAQREAREDVQKAKQEASETKQEARQDAQKAQAEASQESREAEKEVRETQRDASKQVQETRKDAYQDRQAAAGTSGEKKKHAFEGGENFDVDGKVQKVSSRSITIAREELPAVTLQIQRFTEIQLDGEKTSHVGLKPGQEVKASFNLQGDKPIALEIDAKKMSQ